MRVGLTALLIASGPLLAGGVRAADGIGGTVLVNPLSVSLTLSSAKVERGTTLIAAGTVRNDAAVAVTDVGVTLASDSGLVILDGAPTVEFDGVPARGHANAEWTLCAAEPGLYLVALHAVGNMGGEQLTADSPTRIVEVTAGDRVCGGFRFAGFFPPVNNPPTTNVVAGGRTVPVKFSLGGDQGLEIFEAGYPASVRVSCESGVPVDAVEETLSTSASGLTYDPASDQYTYTWKTQRAWRGTCRQLIVRLSDGSIHRANFKFT